MEFSFCLESSTLLATILHMVLIEFHHSASRTRVLSARVDNSCHAQCLGGGGVGGSVREVHS
jgi:hypothetical protein